MSTSDPVTQSSAALAPERLRTARVLRVEEERCLVVDGEVTATVGFAPMFPGPRMERVSPGHLVALATRNDGREVVVWRWYDAVVLGAEDAEGGTRVRLWEPAHGEVLARPRPAYRIPPAGARAFASTGLSGADWWVADGVDGARADARVELDEVLALYSDNGLWSTVLADDR